MTLDHAPNKVDLVRKGALATVVGAMKRHRKCAPVQRQGVGLLFSCLMACEGVDVARVREVALSNGVDDAVKAAAAAHPADKSITAMAKQILAARR